MRTVDACGGVVLDAQVDVLADAKACTPSWSVRLLPAQPETLQLLFWTSKVRLLHCPQQLQQPSHSMARPCDVNAYVMCTYAFRVVCMCTWWHSGQSEGGGHCSPKLPESAKFFRKSSYSLTLSPASCTKGPA